MISFSLIILCFLLLVSTSLAYYKTGFWYNETRPPDTSYISVLYADFSVRINRPFFEGPGSNLLSDPFQSKQLFTGNTVNRQSFDTQFVLDLSYSLGIDSNRVFVKDVNPGDVHYTWKTTNVIVLFSILEKEGYSDQGMTLLETIATLTNQIQNQSSPLYHGTNVTVDIDPLYGLQVNNWDISIKLSYSIESIGGESVRDGYYLNQGGLGSCDTEDVILYSHYCEFERFFEDDLSRALSISVYRVQIMFIKQASFDSVLVFFRILPPNPSLIPPEQTVEQSVGNLIEQIQDRQSLLYTGNVTLRVDPTWGVSGMFPVVTREAAPLFTQKHWKYDPVRLENERDMMRMTSYDRCKANRRCNWGIADLNQHTNDVRFYHQLFDQGLQYEISLFLDFEDWRLGTRGFSWLGSIPPTQESESSLIRARADFGRLRGAHFWPFDEIISSTTQDIPAYLTERNQGLILDRQTQQLQMTSQESLIIDIEGNINWITENMEWINMDSKLRSRKDVRRNQTNIQGDMTHWWMNEINELKELNSSQCVMYSRCVIIFNTSSALMTGAIEGIGKIKLTEKGTEVAVFTFNSIYLGPETEILLVGQRALSLVSKTSMIINTTFHAHPGTLGGFPGGLSIGRYKHDLLNDFPQSIFICQYNNYCSTQEDLSFSPPNGIHTPITNYPISGEFISNNINGPGSGNLRIKSFVIQTSADVIPEIQQITTTALEGQTLSGGFVLHYKGYSTPIIPHDATSSLVKRIIESNLNLNPPQNAPVDEMRILKKNNNNNNNPLKPPPSSSSSSMGKSIGVAGVGIVDVRRSKSDNQEGYSWTITFLTAIGNLPQLTMTSYLQGLQSNITIQTIQDGNEITGSFKLMYQNQTTLPIDAKETADGMRLKLLDLPMISTVHVTRLDPTENCDDGLCAFGPHLSRGMVWTIYMTTDHTYDNITPLYPNSPFATQEGPHYQITAEYSSTLLGSNAHVTILNGLSSSPEDMASLLNIPIPFSLAFGGGGASYGGLGGRGYGMNPIANVYNDEKMTDLLGGSGGAMRSADLYQINAVLGRTIGRGGSGGGAIEFIAANDLVIGNFGVISMRGEDAEQTSEGGGGGGSGGAILLSAGGVIYSQGHLDVKGGDGGFGGVNHLDMAGGGGGGGRIAMYAESITLIGTNNTQGGDCGRYKIPVPELSVVMNISVLIGFHSPLYDLSRLAHLGALYINQTLTFTSNSPTINPFSSTLQQSSSQQMYLVPITTNVIYLSSTLIDDHNILFTYNVTTNQSPFLQSTSGSNLSSNQTLFQSSFSSSSSSSSTTSSSSSTLQTTMKDDQFFFQQIFNSTKGMKIGEVFFMYSLIDTFTYQFLYPTKSILMNCNNPGQQGTLYTESMMTSQMFIARDHLSGAENTQSALFFSNREMTKTSTGSIREAPFSWNGPIVPFEASRPERITYYSKLDSIPINSESMKSNFGAMFTLLNRGDEKLNISNVIGIFLGAQLMHGANFGSSVDENSFLKRMVTIEPSISLDRWYKIDIHLNWEKKTYSVSVDDYMKVLNQPFIAEDIDAIRISVWRAVDVWFDEIYVGFDNTMQFICPSSSRTGTRTDQPIQKHWSYTEVHGGDSPGYTEYQQMTRHYSFLDPTGLTALDGQGQVKDYQDIKLSYSNGDYLETQGKLKAGTLLYLTNTLRSGRSSDGVSNTLVNKNGLWFVPDNKNQANNQVGSNNDNRGGPGDGRYFWYTEHYHHSQISNVFDGGIVACSSQDLINWRFEGIVFHFINLTDQVYGSQGPFHLERPKVLWNEIQQNYVLWSIMDNNNRSLAMSSILTSPYEDGPFLFRRSFYPDGNQTRDQVVFVHDDGIPVLARTYYQTVEYVIPEAIMQPIWESVKNRDGSTNYSLNFHRAQYRTEYDNYHDIYLQRWRKEDVPFSMKCVNKMTGVERIITQEQAIGSDESLCIDPDEYKVVEGLGTRVHNQPGTIISMFLNPNSTRNSWWMQTSVPAVKAQPWASSYRDGFCGIRQLDDDYDVMDPDLEFKFTPRDRSTCSNIADNPVHATIQDQLIGVQKVIMTRRAKYLAFSALTPDYLDTNGYLTTFEGEFLAGDLMSFMPQYGQFGFSVQPTIRSTFQPPVRGEWETAMDYQIRFRQYIRTFNDRATFSLACVLDGVCPVNFKDQINSTISS